MVVDILFRETNQFYSVKRLGVTSMRYASRKFQNVCTNRRIKFASVSLYANVKISRRFPTEEAHVAAESQECRNTSFMNYDYVEGVTYVF